jgi:transcriptional regulator with XRE-family HTH domain
MASREKEKKIQAEGIGTRLRGLRTAEKLSVRDFGKKHGFSYSLWSDYENDRRRPNADTMGKLRDKFQVSADWVIFGIEPARTLKDNVVMEVITHGINKASESSKESTKPKRSGKKDGHCGNTGDSSTRGIARHQRRQR